MLRTCVLILLLVPSLAIADPAASLDGALQLRDVMDRIFDRIGGHAGAVAGSLDLTMLTTEPVERTESSGYGWREDPIRKRQRFHHGTDYRGQPGTPVLAAGDGVVIFAARRGGYGRVVFVDHGGGVVTRYAHLRRIDVAVGDPVAAGGRIGQLGSSGRTTGPHLHFEVRLDGRSVDPNTALAVAELMRVSPTAGQLAALTLAPEVQANAHDREDPGNRRASRPGRTSAPKHQLALW